MSSKANPNVIPLCDILLVLLIIFMVITPMIQKGIDTQLPEISPGPSDGIILTVKKDMNVLINREEVALNMLQGRLKEIYSTRENKTIFLRADAKLPYKKVVEVIDITKGAGVELLGIIAEHYTEEEI